MAGEGKVFINKPSCMCMCAFVGDSPLTRYEAVEIWLDGFELVNIILPLFIRDLPGIFIAAGLTLDLTGRRRRGHSSYRRVFL